MIVPGEKPLAAAKREFAEETGYSPRGKAVPLGDARQPGGKIVHVWALEGDFEPDDLRSNMPVATRKILKGQAVFLARLLAAIGS